MVQEYRVPCRCNSNAFSGGGCAGCVLLLQTAVQGTEDDSQVPGASEFLPGDPFHVCHLPTVAAYGIGEYQCGIDPRLYRHHGSVQPMEYQRLL